MIFFQKYTKDTEDYGKGSRYSFTFTKFDPFWKDVDSKIFEVKL